MTTSQIEVQRYVGIFAIHCAPTKLPCRAIQDLEFCEDELAEIEKRLLKLRKPAYSPSSAAVISRRAGEDQINTLLKDTEALLLRIGEFG